MVIVMHNLWGNNLREQVALYYNYNPTRVRKWVMS